MNGKLEAGVLYWITRRFAGGFECGFRESAIYKVDGWVLLAGLLMLAGCSTSEPPAPAHPPLIAQTAITGDSMIPEFASGEIVKIELCRFADLKVGDTVIFWREGTKEFVHHRLVALGPNGWTTKGDHNPIADAGVVTAQNFQCRTHHWLRVVVPQ